jgi:hypothetical protein
MWQLREALRRQRKPRSTGKTAKEEKLPRRWTELILRLNDMERCKEQDRSGRTRAKAQGAGQRASKAG